MQLTLKRQRRRTEQLIHTLFLSKAYLPILLFAYVGIGWLLNAYVVPQVVWLGTLFATFHLAWAGFDAIVLSSIWVVGVLSVGAISHAWMWRMPRPYYQIEPFTLLVVWLLALGLVVFTAIVQHHLQKSLSRIQAFYSLIALTWLSLACGALIYRTLTLPSLLR